jgi:chromosomal replication initiator protein
VCAQEAGEEVTRDDKEIVSAMHRALVGRVGKDRHAVWFGRGVRMEPCGTTLRIAAADRFRLDFLKRIFRTDLAEAARAVSGTELALEFIIDPAIAAATSIAADRAGSDAAPAAAPPQAPAAPLAPIAGTAPVESAAPLGEAAPVVPSNDLAASGEPPQSATIAQPHASVPAALPRRAPTIRAAEAAEPQPARRSGRPFASLHDFVASDENRVPFSTAIAAATQQGTYSPLTLAGPPGSGKTHLLEGIWRGVRESRLLTRVVYLSAEQFTNQFLEALRQGGMPLFRRKLRDVEMLLLDDVQFLAGKQSTIVELVHTIDALQRSNRQLVFAADRTPDELKGIGPELITRLKGGLVCSLVPADFPARLGILRQLAVRHAMQVPNDVLVWLAGQVSGDARLLAGAMNRLRAASAAHQRPIDLEFAQSALDDLVHDVRKPVRLPEIVAAVADVFGMESRELQSASKSASVTTPRMLIMFLARKWTRAAHSEISRTLGRKSHSTVVSAQHKVTDWLACGKTVTLGRRQCRIEDAIKRVEAQLRLA